MADPGSARRRAVHVDPRRHGRRDRAPPHRRRPRPQPRRPHLGGERLHAHLRRADAARRPGSRPVRRGPGGPHRPDDLHRRVAGHRTRHDRRHGDRRPGRPGSGRSPALPGRAVGRGPHLRGGRAQPRARHLVGAGRVRRRRGRAARRPAHGGSRLVVGVLRQRAGRRRRDRRPGLEAPVPAPRRRRLAPRRRRCLPGDRRHRPGHRRPDRRGGPRVGVGPDRCAARRRAGDVRPARALVAAYAGAADRPAPPHPAPGARGHVHPVRHHRSAGRGLLPGHVLPAGRGRARPARDRRCCSCPSPSRPWSARRRPAGSSAAPAVGCSASWASSSPRPAWSCPP